MVKTYLNGCTDGVKISLRARASDRRQNSGLHQRSIKEAWMWNRCNGHCNVGVWCPEFEFTTALYSFITLHVHRSSIRFMPGTSWKACGCNKETLAVFFFTASQSIMRKGVDTA